MERRIEERRLPITMANIEIVTIGDNQVVAVVAACSKYAGLTMISFRDEIVRHEPEKYFQKFKGIGDILFVSASQILN